MVIRIKYQLLQLQIALTLGWNSWAAFNYAITASNSPASFNASGLPSGLSVNNTSTGVISGTPTVGGIFNVSIAATNLTGTDTKISDCDCESRSGDYIYFFS